MNYNFNELDKYLRDGGNPEEIAQAFADKLNKAIAVNSNTKKLDEKAKIFCNAWDEYVDLYLSIRGLPKGTSTSDFHLTPAELKKIMDALTDNVAPLLSIYNDFIEEPAKAQNKKKSSVNLNFQAPVECCKNKATTDYEKVIGDFFHSIGL